ncbi:transmembrane protein 120A-like isoform X2 [Limulus polyphemus]|uniref:Transmembrane protein 120A-like isoform X2 n=1 Tax=Limulus polyphemus TaxID=6850 RepID=A0ABM1T5T5_LIMPO|nr:transmembrane protein 120A-like isoform X2 [Limulus polyphemus]
MNNDNYCYRSPRKWGKERSSKTTQKAYGKALDEIVKFQVKCAKGITHQRYRLGQISQSLKQIKQVNEDDSVELQELNRKIACRKEQLHDLEEQLPSKNGPYLQVILGSVNVSLLNKDDRFKYKDEYEQFKLVVTTVILVLSCICIAVYYRVFDSILHFLLVWYYRTLMIKICFCFRVFDSILHFLLVWYYCTLTIRESILVINGSRIKGWWRTNHFLTTLQAGVIIVWPSGAVYQTFRKQFILFTLYSSFLQILQFFYQRGCLYRLRALGKRYNMDITIEGFHSWMWRGLSFLLPFLYFGYAFQLYNAYTLYQLSKSPECADMWQVPVTAFSHLVLFLGNAITTSLVIQQKLKENFPYKRLINT